MIATTDFGGCGDPVVLLHGAGGTAEDWATIAPLLAEQHHVVAVDLPGHGRSPAPTRPWSFARALDELARLELGNPAVVGMSLGGMLAVHWGHRRPDCPAVISLDGHRAPLTASANYPGFSAGDLDTAREDLRAVFAAMAAAAPADQSNVLTGVFDAMHADDTVPLLAIMPCPTLLAVATRSPPVAEAFDDLMAAFRAASTGTCTSLPERTRT